MPALKALVVQYSTVPPVVAPSPAAAKVNPLPVAQAVTGGLSGPVLSESPTPSSGSTTVPVMASLYKNNLHCGMGPLGDHVPDDTKQLIWDNKYIDIWSLVTVDQETVDKEWRAERFSFRRPRVAKTISNWLQAFAVLGCIMGRKHPERCSELFRYMDLIYTAQRTYGGSGWWHYDEQYRRRMSALPELGWDMRSMDLWFRWMQNVKPSPFRASAVPGVSQTGQGSAVVRRPGACWNFNEGQCRFVHSCKFKHECSSCGGSHAAVRCTRVPSKLPGKPSSDHVQKNAGARSGDGAVAR